MVKKLMKLTTFPLPVRILPSAAHQGLSPLVSALLLTALFTPCAAAILEGKLNMTIASNRNLSQEGNLDWAVWGFADGGMSTSLTPDVSKDNGTGIEDLVNLSNGNPLRGLGQFGPFGHTFNWSDGSPIVSNVQALTGLQHNGQQAPSALTIGEGFSLSVGADTVPRTLVLYVTTHLGVGQLNANLSDRGAVPYEEVLNASDRNNASGIFTIRYAANSDGEHLTIRFVLISANNPINSSNVAIQAASLAVAPDLPLSLSIKSSPETLITIYGPLGSTNRIDFSNDLLNPSWKTLTNVVLQGTVVSTFSDPSLALDRRRFYKAVRLE